MDINEQVRIIEAQIHSPIANFSLFEKMEYMSSYFDKDPAYSQEARDIVRGNISKLLKNT